MKYEFFLSAIGALNLWLVVSLHDINTSLQHIARQDSIQTAEIWKVVYLRLNRLDTVNTDIKRALSNQWRYIKALDQDTVVVYNQTPLKKWKKPNKLKP